jgi:hypothetical protein
VYAVHAAPDGSCFIADGLATRDKRSNSIVAYAGRSGEVLWRLPIPDSLGEGSSALDSTGRVLQHWGNRPFPDDMLRPLPFNGQPDVPTSGSDRVGFGRRVVFRMPTRRSPGLQLAAPGAPPFLTLSPDHLVTTESHRFTPDGRFLAWGLEDGTVLVADLERVRRSLEALGMGWPEFR